MVLAWEMASSHLALSLTIKPSDFSSKICETQGTNGQAKDGYLGSNYTYSSYLSHALSLCIILGEKSRVRRSLFPWSILTPPE